MSLIEAIPFSEYNPDINLLVNLKNKLDDWISSVFVDPYLPDEFQEMCNKNIIRLSCSPLGKNKDYLSLLIYDWEHKNSLSFTVKIGEFGRFKCDLHYLTIDGGQTLQEVDFYKDNILSILDVILLKELIPSILKTPDNYIALVFQNLVDDRTMCDMGFIQVATRNIIFGYKLIGRKECIKILNNYNISSGFLELEIEDPFKNVDSYIISLDNLVELECIIRQKQVEFISEINKMELEKEENP